MAKIYKQFVDNLEKWLQSSGRIADVGDKIEKSTGIKRIYVAQCVLALVAIYMIFGYFAELVCNCVGFIYPAYASIHALENVHKEGDTKWLTYWVVYALFSVGEFFSDIIISWFPLYWLAKVVFLIWCFIPIQNNGSNYIYKRIILPIFLKHNQSVDRALSSAVGTAKELVEKTYEAAKAD